MRNITAAAIQMRCVPDPAENLRTAEPPRAAGRR